MDDKISIVVVTFNCKDIINKTLDSIVRQDYNNIELIVIDGKSTDGTTELISKYRDNISTFISEPDDGIYDAMNKGLALTTGEWVFFINAGDVFVSNSVLSEIFHRSYQHYGAVVCNYYNRKKKGVEKVFVTKPFYAQNHEYLSMGFHHQSVFVRTSFAKKIKFNLSFKCCADYYMMVQIYKQGGLFIQVPNFVTIVEGRYGFSNSNYKLQLLEHGRVRGVDKTLRFKLFVLYTNSKILLKKNIKKWLEHINVI